MSGDAPLALVTVSVTGLVKDVPLDGHPCGEYRRGLRHYFTDAENVTRLTKLSFWQFCTLR